MRPYVLKLDTGDRLKPPLIVVDDAAESALAEAKLGAARAYTYQVVGDLWETLQRGDRVAPKMRATYRIMMTYIHQGKQYIVVQLSNGLQAFALP